MRCFEAALPATLLLAGCSTELPGGDLSQPPAPASADASAPLPVATGCLPFRGLAGVAAVSGAVRSVATDDGHVLFVADDATLASGDDVPSFVLAAPAGARVDDCVAGAAPPPSAGAPASALDPPSLSPLSFAGEGLLYYSDPTGAIGVAARDPSDGRYRPSGSVLWTSDRPAYGSATALVTDATGEGGAAETDVNVLGCRGARFLDADCFLARAPATSAGDESAYAYYVGGGRFSPRADDAWPMTTGAASLDVVFVAAISRWVMAYIGPLGDTILVRSGVSPHGPWSLPLPVAKCDLADRDMFCAGLHAHPALTGPPGAIVVSYAPASLSAGVGARRAAEPEKWWPRLAAVALPAALP
jgi:hypothetical protein